MNKRIIAAVATATLAAGLGTAYAASGTSTATGTDGFTPVTQTRVFDSGRIAGDALLGSGHSQTINPNAVTAGLVPASATAVQIQITAAQETSVNGDLDVTPTAVSSPATSNLNYVKGVPITSSTVATLGAGGTFAVYNHGGSAGSVRLVVDVLGYYAPTATYTAPQTVSQALPGVASVATGGSFNARATEVGTVDLPAGSYLVTLSAKATPIVQSNTSVQVFPSIHLYNQPKNPSFAGDVLDAGGTALESGTVTNADLYSSNSGVVTVTQDTTMVVYAFGYDSDSGEGTYQLDGVTVTATPISLASN